MFSNGCFVTDADHRFDDPVVAVTEQGYRIKGPTIIGDNVWCGVNVAIMGGVTIGERCVIGANSVVTRDLEPYTVAAGSPARVIRRIDPSERPPHGVDAFPAGSAGTGCSEDCAS
jgi:acetyltransferase-like isoleucine patch superfamily enzyme